MAKDPAFLFYSKDWIEGTAEMTHEEKGVYIDLLAHQHQGGSLPSDTKRLALVARLSHDEFLRIWEAGLFQKFIQKDNRLVNRKLAELTTERTTIGYKNKVVGTFATLIRQSKWTAEKKEQIKKSFKIDHFLQLPTEELTERLTDWFYKWSPSLVNANGNEDIKEVLVKKEKGENFESENFELPMEEILVPQLISIYHKKFAGRFIDAENDYPAMWNLAIKIGRHEKIESFDADRENFINTVKTSWGQLVDFIPSNKWLSGLSLHSLNGQFANLIQSFNADKNKLPNGLIIPIKPARNGGANDLLNDLRNDFELQQTGG